MATGESQAVTIGTAGKIGLLVFDGIGGQHVGAQVTGVTMTQATVTVYGPSGAVVASTTVGPSGGTVPSTLIPVTGTYTIFVAPSSGTTGSLTLTLQAVPLPPPLTLTYLGPLRDQVGQANTAAQPDGQRDAVLVLTIGAGSGPRTVSELELRRSDGGAAWDTIQSTGFWVLGVGSALDGVLANNVGTAAVSVPVIDGSVLYLFASDTTPSAFTVKKGFTLTAKFADGSVRTVSESLDTVVTAISPTWAPVGTSLTVTIDGEGFQAGTTVSLGPGVTVNGVTIQSATRLTANLTIVGSAAPGLRTVTVSNLGGQASTVFSVTAAPAEITLSYLGKLRDRVGSGSTALIANGTLDGVFKVALSAGSDTRTITQLELRRTDGSAIWDTLAGTTYWVLGAAGGLDSALFNDVALVGGIGVPVSSGGVLYVFANDFAPTPFSVGAGFTLTAWFSDGSVSTATTSIPDVTAGAVTVDRGSTGTSFTATIDGTGFQSGGTVSFGTGITASGVTFVSATRLTATLAIATDAALGPRDVSVTNPGGATGTLSAGFTVTEPPPALTLTYRGKLRDRVGPGSTYVYSDGVTDGVFTVALGTGGGSRILTELELRRTDAGGIWDTVAATGYWALGVARGFDVTLANDFSQPGGLNLLVTDGESLQVFANDVTSTLFVAGMSFTITAKFADGSVRTATAAVPALVVGVITSDRGSTGTSFTATIDGAGFQNGAGVSLGAGVTVSSVTFVSATRLTAAVVIAADAALGPRDVTVTNPGGPSGVLSGGFTVAPPPPPVTLSYLGRLRDRVGAGSTAARPDGVLDGVFTIVLGTGAGGRTVTEIELRRTDGSSAWDTVSGSGSWALGSAAGLDVGLHNDPGSAAIALAVSDGETIYLFGNDKSPTPFASGAGFSVDVKFSDGSVGTATATIAP
jgi:hypothetical protein